MNWLLVLGLSLFSSCSNTKGQSYTASTPAGLTIRSFLGIAAHDSIDFIRWQLSIDDTRFRLTCNYGIGKPNTNGFIDGGNNVAFTGACKQEPEYITLQYDNREIRLQRINENLLHFVDDNNQLMAGNGGWSYTLNNVVADKSGRIRVKSVQHQFKDSSVYIGRTPCGVPGILPKGQPCYKLKWKLVLYANKKGNPTTFRIFATNWRTDGGKTGKWEINTTKNGPIVYNLFDETGNHLLQFIKADDSILFFTDKKEILLTGDEDFSYTLNKTE